MTFDHGPRIGDQLDALIGNGGDIAKLRNASANVRFTADLGLREAICKLMERL